MSLVERKFWSLTVGLRHIGPEYVFSSVDDLVHFFLVPQELEVDEARLISAKEIQK